MDFVQDESASLGRESQDCSDEQKGYPEGTCSAAPPAQNEKSATVFEGQVKPSQPTSLLIENQAPSKELKTPYEGDCSAAPVT